MSCELLNDTFLSIPAISPQITLQTSLLLSTIARCITATVTRGGSQREHKTHGGNRRSQNGPGFSAAAL